jgi:hypothetical protein
MPLILSGSVDISGSMTATTIVVSAPGGGGMVSSSQQIQNYNLFAVTSSANTFYGNQGISGSLNVTRATGTSVTPQLTVNNTTTNGYGILRLVGAARGGIIDFYNTSSAQASIAANDGELQIYTNEDSSGTPKVTINSSGNLGVGTTLPTTKLEVVGTTHLISTAGNITGINIIPGSVTNTYQTIGESTAPGGVVRFHAGIVTGWANWENYGASYMDFKIEIKGSGTSDTSYTAMQIRPTGDIRMSILVGTGTRTVVADANGQLSAPVSDESLKENIRPIGYGINEIMQMNPVWFEFKDEFKNYGETRQNGNIAQEMVEIIPEAVFTTPKTGMMGINYEQLHAVYIKAMQEQQAIIDSLIARIETLENK